MDSAARLDYALFQLTPTRTRFDLVLFYGRNSEKLASGLFEPFISHLKFARDEISKGGYSITLRPPSHAAPWFTKATFERFVRFVSTPAVLERFVSIEKEILQIEVSVQANELSNAKENGQMEQGSGSFSNGITRKSSDSSMLKGEVERDNDFVQEDNSKIQLQRLLETRRALLRKEQAMAFARGLVAGFEMDSIDDLISFADAYGASRLREACINFKELWRKKHGDGLWMEELAAMEACSPGELSFLGSSGIVLTNETSAPDQNVLLNFAKVDMSGDTSKDSTASNTSSDSKKDDNLPASGPKVQVPVTWQNQLPPYMYGFQGPVHQLPPYQGYPFPPMHPQYAGNVQWPPNMKGRKANIHSKQKSSSRKERFLNTKDSEYSGEETQTESSHSDFESDSDSNIQQDNTNSSEHSYKKKHKNKSSKMVVIRNINYITPKRRNGEKGGDSEESSSEEDKFLDEDSLKKKIDVVVGLSKKSRKANSSRHKKRDANKSLNFANGSNDASDQDFDDNSVEDSSKQGKGKDKWDAFQNLLMRDEEETVNRVETLRLIDVQDEHLIIRSSEGGISSTTSPAVDLESEKVPKKQIIDTDSFVLTERGGRSEDRVKLEGFENGENFRSVLKTGNCVDADFLLPRTSEESGLGFGDILSTCASELSTFKTVKGEDLFIVNHLGKSETGKGTNGQTIFDSDCIFPVGDNFHHEKCRKDILNDDSIMIQARSATDDLYEHQWKTDISMDVDLTSAASPGNGAANGKHDVYEPNDLCMVLERESEFQSSKDSWSMDYGIDVSFEEPNKRCSGAEDKLSPNCEDIIVKNNQTNGAKSQGKEGRSKVPRGSLGKSKPELMSKSRKPSLMSRPAVHKSKLEKEEEMRKKMEELMIERQKRIAERTAANGLAPAATKKAPLQSKTAKGPIKSATARETERIGSVKIRAT